MGAPRPASPGLKRPERTISGVELILLCPVHNIAPKMAQISSTIPEEFRGTSALAKFPFEVYWPSQKLKASKLFYIYAISTRAPLL